ncbi:hypothetical protein LOAG_07395 [Loa loa]|uniref:Uncharacterized protein n=1 Tax=Loa loa TaxID=7209 RepID=A0A1S0TW00_LOALO|nr:hypothetical protein LOAG_07395 [Loa loa]EFO21097.1 hypothetical protein LOAG_07395 [Loa loa]
MQNSNSQLFGIIILLWLLILITTHCHPNMDENFVADILPMDIFVESTKSKEVYREIKGKDDIEMSMAISEITDSINYRKSSNLTISGNNSSEIQNSELYFSSY